MCTQEFDLSHVADRLGFGGARAGSLELDLASLQVQDPLVAFKVGSAEPVFSPVCVPHARPFHQEGRWLGLARYRHGQPSIKVSVRGAPPKRLAACVVTQRVIMLVVCGSSCAHGSPA